MDDYVRATQLQQSLKKRITALMKQKEAEAERRADEARIVLLEAEDEKFRLNRKNQILKEKMMQLETGDKCEKAPTTPVPIGLAQTPCSPHSAIIPTCQDHSSNIFSFDPPPSSPPHSPASEQPSVGRPTTPYLPPPQEEVHIMPDMRHLYLPPDEYVPFEEAPDFISQSLKTKTFKKKGRIVKS